MVRHDLIFFFSSRRRHTRCSRDWSSDVCSSDLFLLLMTLGMAFSGQVLRFDQDAYWGLGIGASIASRVPIAGPMIVKLMLGGPIRSEERRVGKECRSRWSPYH